MKSEIRNPNPRIKSEIRNPNEGADGGHIGLTEPVSGVARYDLPERTAKFGEAIVRFARGIPITPTNQTLVRQLVRAGTSIGANYCEADDAESKKDFRHKIGICRKEAKESKYWLRMIAAAEPTMSETARTLWQEAKELNLIFGTIRRKCE
jgi:four helix bundle protein